MRVLFVAHYGPSAPSSRTRVFQFLPFLETRGVAYDLEVVVSDALLARGRSSARWVRVTYYLRCLWQAIRVGLRCLLLARNYHVLFIQKVVFPFPLPWLLRRHRKKVVFDFDDAIFTTDTPPKGWLDRVRRVQNAHGVAQMLRSAGHAIVENRYTGEFAGRYCRCVSTITGPVDIERYRPGRRETRSGVVLGWIGSRSTERYLELIRDPLAELGHRYAHVRLSLVGAESFDVASLRAVRHDWSLETEGEHLRRFDIGLMPLPDDPWTRGKGGYKLLQYLALGIPVVASPVGINREIVAPGENGFLASTASEWVDHLERLIRDAPLRRRMGNAGRMKIASEFSLETGRVRFLSILESVAAR